MGDRSDDLTGRHVVVIGADALGADVADGLARAGVGTIAIVDHAPGAARRVADAVQAVAPGTTAIAHQTRFAPGTTFDLLLDADLVVEATGHRDVRYLANDAAAIRGIPMVWGEAHREEGRAGVAWEERGIDYRDFEPETGDAAAPVRRPGPMRDAARAIVTAIVVAESLKLLTGSGEPMLGRVAIVYGATGQVGHISYARTPGAPRPGSLEERTALPEPRPVRDVDPLRLAAELGGEHPPVLVDVREPWEADIARLPGSRLIPLGELRVRARELDPGDDIVLYCHHGVRSARALEYLEQLGFERVRHLTGGIDAWSAEVDPELPRY